MAVYSFGKRPQSASSPVLPASSSRELSASSLSQDAEAQLQANELGHTVNVWNVQLFSSLPEGDLASLWAHGNQALGFGNFQAKYTVAGGFVWRAPTYAELERLLEPMQTSTLVNWKVPRIPLPTNVFAPVRAAPSPLQPPIPIPRCPSKSTFRLINGSTETSRKSRAPHSSRQNLPKTRSKSQVAIYKRSTSRNLKTRSQVAIGRQSARRNPQHSAIWAASRVQSPLHSQTQFSTH